MKKFLSIFSCVVVTGSLGAGTSSCSSSFDHKTDNGATIDYHLPITNKDFSANDLWNYLNLNNDKDFQKTIDSNWNVSSIPGSIKGKITQYVYKIFNTAFLAGLADDKGIAMPVKFKNVAGFGDLKRIFKLMWTDLSAEVEAQVKQEKKSQGKNWKKWLKDNYDGSEKKYRAHLFVFGGKGVISASDFLNNFMFNYQTDYGTIISQQVINIANTIITAIKSSKESTITNLQWAQFAISQYQYASSSTLLDKSKTISDFKSNFISFVNSHPTIKDYHSLFDRTISNNPYVDITGKKIYQIDSAKTIEQDTLVKTLIYDNYNSDLSNNNEPGLFSPFQLFIERNWFKTKKPLAVSQILFKYGSDGGKNVFDITKHNFNDPLYNSLKLIFSTKTYNNFKAICALLKINQPVRTSSSWDQTFTKIPTLYGDDANIVATKSKDFLTPDGTEDANSGFNSDIQKLAVYGNLEKITSPDAHIRNLVDYVPNSPTINKIFGRPTSPHTGVAGPLTALDRSQSSRMAGVFHINKGNVIAYFDKLGLHLVHIDGSTSNSNTNQFKNSTYDPASINRNALVHYKKTSSNTDDTNTLYGNINKYNKETNTDNSRATGIFDNFKSSAPYLNFLNKYQFLAQSKEEKFQSLNLQGLNYDLQTVIQNYGKFDTSAASVSNSATFWYWSFSLAKFLLQTSNNDKTWLSKILDFKDNAGANKIKQIFIKIIDNYLQLNKATALSNLTSAFQAIKTSIDSNYKGPQGNFELNTVLNQIGLDTNKYWNVGE